jgi:hypothetical protein
MTVLGMDPERTYNWVNPGGRHGRLVMANTVNRLSPREEDGPLESCARRS